MALGEFHTCVMFDDASVRCWGLNKDGQLGIGSTANIGDGLVLSGPNIGQPKLDFWIRSALNCQARQFRNRTSSHRSQEVRL